MVTGTNKAHTDAKGKERKIKTTSDTSQYVRN